jgi:drug/metabolite transporter (DMT)-like permease
VLSIPILGETVRLRRWAAVGVGLLGVLIVLRPGAVELGLGHAAALMAAICGAVGAVIVRRIGPDERPVVFLLYPMVANFTLMGCLMPLVYEPMPAGDLGLMALVAALGFCATLIIVLAYRTGSASVVAPMQYSQIVWATDFGALFFGETPDRWTLLGAAVVIGSGLYILFREGQVSDVAPNLKSRGRIETGISPRMGPRPRSALPKPHGLATGLDAVRQASMKAPPGRGGLANLRRPE